MYVRWYDGSLGDDLLFGGRACDLECNYRITIYLVAVYSRNKVKIFILKRKQECVTKKLKWSKSY